MSDREIPDTVEYESSKDFFKKTGLPPLFDFQGALFRISSKV